MNNLDTIKYICEKNKGEERINMLGYFLKIFINEPSVFLNVYSSIPEEYRKSVCNLGNGQFLTDFVEANKWSDSSLSPVAKNFFNDFNFADLGRYEQGLILNKLRSKKLLTGIFDNTTNFNPSESQFREIIKNEITSKKFANGENAKNIIKQMLAKPPSERSVGSFEIAKIVNDFVVARIYSPVGNDSSKNKISLLKEKKSLINFAKEICLLCIDDKKADFANNRDWVMSQLIHPVPYTKEILNHSGNNWNDLIKLPVYQLKIVKNLDKFIILDYLHNPTAPEIGVKAWEEIINNKNDKMDSELLFINLINAHKTIKKEELLQNSIPKKFYHMILDMGSTKESFEVAYRLSNKLDVFLKEFNTSSEDDFIWGEIVKNLRKIDNKDFAIVLDAFYLDKKISPANDSKKVHKI